jgi:hypothetical protein
MAIADVPPRSARARADTWNDASIFETLEVWEAAFQRVSADLSSLGEFQGRFHDGPDTLVVWFDTASRVLRLLGQVVVYASYRRWPGSSRRFMLERSAAWRSPQGAVMAEMVDRLDRLLDRRPS